MSGDVKLKIQKVQKKYNGVEKFDPQKIYSAIFKSFQSVYGIDGKFSKQVEKVYDRVLKKLEKYEDSIISVDDIDNFVEESLASLKEFRVLTAYITHRIHKISEKRIREEIEVKDDIGLTTTALNLLKKRYLFKDDRGNIIETPKQMFKRVAKYFSLADAIYDEEIYKQGELIVYDEKSIFKVPKNIEEIMDLEIPREVYSKLSFSAPIDKKSLLDYGLSVAELEALARTWFFNNLEGRAKKSLEDTLRYIAEHRPSYSSLYRVLVNRDALFNSPALINAGRNFGTNSACLYGHNQVFTESGLVNIADIKEGMEVLTHTGKFEKVTEVMTRNYTGNIYRIRVLGYPNGYILDGITEDHPVLVYPKEYSTCIRCKNMTCYGMPDSVTCSDKYRAKQCEYYKEAIKHIEWRNVQDLKVGDYLLAPVMKEEPESEIDTIKISDFLDLEHMKYIVINGMIYRKIKDNNVNKGITVDGNQVWRQVIPVNNEIKLDKDFLLLAGRYISDGCLHLEKTLEFFFAPYEEDYVSDTIRALRSVFSDSLHINVRKEHCIILELHNKVITQLFKKLFGEGFSAKRIPAWMFSLSKEQLYWLLKGVIEGDGTYVNHKTSNKNNVRIKLANKTLIHQLYFIATKIGFKARIQEYRGKNKQKHDAWELYIINVNNMKELNMDLKDAQRKRKIRKTITVGDRKYYLYRIKEIKKEYVENEKVYNLEVKNDHSYVVNIVSVHNCFLLEIQDDMKAILDALKTGGLIYKAGGGVGYYFGHLREKGALINTTKGKTQGPLSFMELFNTLGLVVKQAAVRDAAALAALPDWHPDVMDFIDSKAYDNSKFTGFNISVTISRKFLRAVENNEIWELKSPSTGEVVKKIPAVDMWNKIIQNAHRSAEPGILFVDEANADNPILDEKLKGTNPCVTGDTLILTKNGPMKMKDIVEKGEDVDVYTLADNGEIVIRTLRNPRMTYKAKQIYKVVLYNGQTLRVSEDHKFILADGTEKMAKDLEFGDMLEGRVFKNGEVTNYDYTKDLFLKSPEMTRAEKQGYQVIVTNLGKVLVRKRCKVCGKKFSVRYHDRDIDICSPACLTEYKLNNKNIDGVSVVLWDKKKTYGTRTLRNDIDKIEAYIEAQLYAGRPPTYDGEYKFTSDMREVSVVPLHSKSKRNKGFKSFYELRYFVETIGLRVERVEPDGIEPVYNGTVDKTHKYMIGTDGYDTFFVTRNCGEIWLFDKESCNLASINLSNMVDDDGKFNWRKFRSTIRLMIRMLDNVIDMNRFPDYAIYESVRKYRRLGLGVMGYADMLIKMGIKYGSREALRFTHELGKVFLEESVKTSAELAKTRGVFPRWHASVFQKIIDEGREAIDKYKPEGKGIAQYKFKREMWEKYPFVRNVAVTTVAPCGSISIIAGVSSSIEPIFSFVYTRRMIDIMYVDVHPLFKELLQKEGIYSDELIDKVAQEISVQNIVEIPERLRKVLVTTYDVTPEEHVYTQAVWQQYITNSIAKTCNLPASATPSDVEKAYKLAAKHRCKGITVYRESSREGVILAGKKLKENEENKKPSIELNVHTKVVAEEDYAGGCPTCHT